MQWNVTEVTACRLSSAAAAATWSESQPCTSIYIYNNIYYIIKHDTNRPFSPISSNIHTKTKPSEDRYDRRASAKSYMTINRRWIIYWVLGMEGVTSSHGDRGIYIPTRQIQQFQDSVCAFRVQESDSILHWDKQRKISKSYKVQQF